VRASGSLAISTNTARNLQNYTLEVNTPSATWTGTQSISTGSGAVMRVTSGSTLLIQGDPTFTFNLGGSPTLFDNVGTITRNTSAGIALFQVTFNHSGTLNV